MFAQEVFEHAGHGGCRGRRFAWIRGGGFEMPGGFAGPRAGFGRGFGHGRERLFDAGDIKLVILKLLSEQPSYGYQLIKTMEERLGGGYSPSAGVVYPTLTMLEEEGLATSASTDGKKVYSVTPEGKLIRTIPLPELAANLEFGGPDLKTLFITARTSVYRVRVDDQGWTIH